MPLTHPYHDQYLGPLVTGPTEERAVADVDALGSFPAAWAARLVVLRTYILTCLDSQRAPEDLFTAKLAVYRKEFDATLPQAKAAQAAAEAEAGNAPSGGASIYTVELQRS